MATRGRARNGQGSIVPRTTARGKIVYDAWTPSLQDPETGKKKRFPKRGFATEALAAEWIAKKVNEITQGLAAVERRGGLTVDQVKDRWAASSPLKESTIEAHLYNYQNMGQGFLGSRPIGEVRSTEIDAMFAELTKKYTPAVLVLLIRALVNFWDYAVRDELAKSNVIHNSPWRQKLYRMAEDRKAEKHDDEEEQEDGLIRVFLPEQARDLIELERQEYYRRYWHFILLTGARRGEGLGLKWSDIDFDKGTVRISENVVRVGKKILTMTTPKGNRRRRIPVAPEVLELLREQKSYIDRERRRYGAEWVEHDLVFPRTFRHRIALEPIGGRQDPKAVSETFLRRCRQLGLPEISLHGLRHTFASAAYAAGVDLKTIQDIMGHRVEITTLVYVHTDKEKKRDAIVRVVDYLRQAD